MATNKKGAGKKAGAKAKPATSKPVKKKSAVATKAIQSGASPPSASDRVRAPIIGATSGSVVRERVIAIFANVCGKKPSEVDGPKLSELTAKCDVPFRAQIASAVNAEFNDLLQPYGSDNVACSATVSTLSLQIIRDQA